jgi:general secretion pathway protein D
MNMKLETRILAVLALLTAAAAPVAAQGTEAPRVATRGGAPVTLNFVNADIEGVTRAVAAMIGRQIVVDPRVRGTITLTSEQPQSIREAFQSYQVALRGLGFAVVESAGLLKLVPEADAKLQTGTVGVGEVPARGDQIITQIFSLRHENANNLVAILRPLISANNTINANPGSNTLVITDYADNLQRIAKIIAALDNPSATEIEVIALKHAVASDIVPLVQRLTDGGTVVAVPGAPGIPGQSTVLADARSNSIIVRAPNAARLAVLKATIERLDRPTGTAGPGGGMWVVHLKNAEAVRLATVLRAAFAAGSSGGAATGAAPAFPTAPTTPTITPGAIGAGASAQATAPIQGAAQPSTGGFIQADPATNSLIITGPEPLYRQVRAMIDQLDTRRAQVYIESLIVEVTGDNAADFGFQWQGLIGKDGDKNIGVLGTNLATQSTVTGGVPSIINITTQALGGAVTVGGGLNVGLIRNFNGAYALAAIAQFLQTQSNTNIVSTPNQITLDNEEAKIIVGRNVPFITGQFTATGTGTTNPFQTIERKDVGLTLRVKPQIGEGGTVRMTIFLESSDVVPQATGTQNAGPTTSKRSIESNVVVDDGQILVLGGLIEERFEENRNKVPLLGDLPGVGALFRSETRVKKRSNLMVFLRPTVMRDAESAHKLSLDRYDLIRGRQIDAQPQPSAVLPINGAPVIPPAREGAASDPAKGK